jgi:hypothetical protein
MTTVANVNINVNTTDVGLVDGDAGGVTDIHWSYLRTSTNSCGYTVDEMALINNQDTLLARRDIELQILQNRRIRENNDASLRREGYDDDMLLWMYCAVKTGYDTMIAHERNLSQPSSPLHWSYMITPANPCGYDAQELQSIDAMETVREKHFYELSILYRRRDIECNGERHMYTDMLIDHLNTLIRFVSGKYDALR